MNDEFSLKRKGVKALLILSILTAVFLAVGIFLIVIVPRNKTVDTTNLGSVQDFAIDYDGEGVYYGTSQGKVVEIADNGRQKSVFDVALAIEEKYNEKYEGEKIHVSKILTLEEFSSVYVIMSHGKLYRLEKTSDGGLELVGRATFDGTLEAYATDGEDIYFLSKVKSYSQIYCYDGELNGEKPLRSSYLYEFAGNKEVGGEEIVTMEISKGVVATSMSVIEDRIYLLTQTGVYSISASFEANNWQGMTEEECEALGVNVDKTYGRAEVPYSLLKINNDSGSETENLYYSINGFSDKSAGSGYDEKSQTFYTVHFDRTAGSFTLDDIGYLYNEESFEVSKIEGIDLVQTPQSKDEAMSFNADKLIGYVYYENSDFVSKIDFGKKQLIYSAKVDFDISKISATSDDGNLFYLYSNIYESEIRGQKIFAFVNANLIKSKGLIVTFSIICCSVAVVLILVSLLVLACVRSKRAYAYTMDVLKGFVKHKLIYIILGLSAGLLIFTCYYPGVASMVQSMFDYTLQKPTMKWNNFANYKEIFTAGYASEAFGNMLIFLITDIIVGIAPPMLFAFALSIMRNKMSERVYKTLMFLPGILPGVAKTLIWKTGIYGEDGVINTILGLFNLSPIKFLDSSAWAMPSLILMGFPFVGAYLVFYGAMLNIPSSCYEAAELEGCGAIRRFFTINIPLIAAQTKYVFITSFIHSVQNFARVYMITNGEWGTQTPINTMYNKMVSGNYGVASAYATVLFAFLAVVTVFNLKAQLKSEKEGAY